MTKLKTFLSRFAVLCKRSGKWCAAHPFAVPAAVTALLAAILAAPLPQKLEPIVNALSFAVARRIAGTGIADLAATQSDATSLLTQTAAAMLLYIAAVWLSLRCARAERDRLRAAVQEKRTQLAADGHQPPENWEQDVERDIARVSASIAAVPEWLMLLAGLVIMLGLMPKLPLLPALLLPITAIAVCFCRDHQRVRRLPQPAQATVVAAIWVAGTLAVLVLLLRQADPSIPLGLIVRCAITMALIIPAALQLPYRSIQPIITALKRLRGFLK